MLCYVDCCGTSARWEPTTCACVPRACEFGLWRIDALGSVVVGTSTPHASFGACHLDRMLHGIFHPLSLGITATSYRRVALCPTFSWSFATALLQVGPIVYGTSSNTIAFGFSFTPSQGEGRKKITPPGEIATQYGEDKCCG